MAVTYIGERKGAFSRKNNTLTTTRILLYKATMGEYAGDIYAQKEIPSFGAAHPKNASLLCSSVEVPAVPHNRSGLFEVQCEYTDDSTFAGVGELNPTVRLLVPWARPLYNFSSTSIERDIAFTKAYQDGDKFGEPTQPVINSCGDPIEAKTTESILSLKFQYNLQTWNDNWTLNYANTVNSVATTIAGITLPKHCAMLKGLQATGVYEEKIGGGSNTSTGNKEMYYFYQINVEILCSKKPWVAEIANLGYNAIFTKAANNKPMRIYTDDKVNTNLSYLEDPDYGVKTAQNYANPRPVDTPQFLDKDGHVLVLTPGGTAKPVYQTFYERFYTTWNVLNLPKTRGAKETWRKV